MAKTPHFPASFVDLLACPRCAAPLGADREAFRCTACAVEYPSVAKLPWLFADPEAKLAEWKSLAAVGLGELRESEALQKEALRATTLTPLAQRRMRKMLQATVENRKTLLELFEPFVAAATVETNADELRVLSKKLAATQSFSAYATNLFRDWAWSEAGAPPEADENIQALSAVLRAAAASHAGGDLMILGAGAGRLAFDLAFNPHFSRVLATDVHPILLSVGARAAAGRAVSLHELPLMPDGIDNAAVARRLVAPSAAPAAKLAHAFVDALEPALAREKADTVLTPWLLDILPESPALFAERVNALLKPGGVWLFHGTTAFRDGLSRDELLDLVGAAGFELVFTETVRLPYLCSPASGHGRRENVLGFAAKKVESRAMPAPFRVLPRWLAEGAEPIPRPQGLAQLALMHSLYAEVLALVDGRTTLVQLTAALAARKNLDPAALRGALTSFFAGVAELS